MNLPPEGVDAWIKAMATHSPVTVGVAPPFPFLQPLRERGALRVAAQNCAAEREGAFTGEVSAAMIASTGADWIIVGHSERRNLFGESPSTIGKKLHMVHEAGLVPLLCIGESESVREAGKTDSVLREQLLAALEGVNRSASLILAYEPVWAIGTGRNATPAMVLETHGAVASILEGEGFGGVPILYGGSVNPDNAAELAGVEGVSGFLVGGASLSSTRFRGIVASLESIVGANSKKG